jgi:hypothetical protein
VVPKNPIKNNKIKNLFLIKIASDSLFSKMIKTKPAAAIRLVKLAKKRGDTKETPYLPNIGWAP